MKTMKKVLAVLVSMVMVLAFCVTGVAANVELTQHTFAAYQIFKGDLTEGNKLSNVTWGDGVQGKELLAELNNQEAFATCASAADVAKVLETYNTDSTKANAFAKTAAAHVTETKTEGTGKVDLPAAGYYLIVDTTATTGTYDAKNLSLLKVNGAGTVTPATKTDKPTLEKKVKDINDSTGSESDWQDSADYDIGDEIPYKLTATMGDLSNYDHYYLNFHDTMTHLTLVEGSVEVKVGEKTLALEKNQYTVAWDDDNKTMDVAIMDVKAHGATTGTEVTVTYKATLDADAVLGSTGNPNTADLEYSNNPNNTGNGMTKPNDTGKTPEDKNIVFTYKVTANKVKENEQPLEGAEFELFKKVGKESWISKGKLTGTGDNKNVFEWKGLDDGAYKIVETKTPSGYNTIDPIEFTITAEHDTTEDNPELKKLSGDVFTGNVTTGAVSANIVNKSGSTLPETGGIGTTVFYVIGGMLMAAAAVLLITKKRMNNK